METVGQIRDIQITFPERKTIVTIEVEAAPADVERLRDRRLTVNLKRYRKKRSMTSNAYYWLLAGKLAKVQNISLTEMHNRLLADYGAESVIDGALEWSLKPRDFNWLESTECHYRPSGRSVMLGDGTVVDIYWVIRGSRTYNTEEMARLIDGVIYECKANHIETMTPDELARMFAGERNGTGAVNQVHGSGGSCG